MRTQAGRRSSGNVPILRRTSEAASGHPAQAATGGYLQTALLELRVICVDIELIAVGCA
jgi:hypothetical protein